MTNHTIENHIYKDSQGAIINHSLRICKKITLVHIKINFVDGSEDLQFFAAPGYSEARQLITDNMARIGASRYWHKSLWEGV